MGVEIGGHNEKQNIEIVKIICKELGKPESLITHVGNSKGHDMRYAIDLTRADSSAETKASYVFLDITDKDAVEKVITEVNPDAVIHCAAWIAVDMAEDDDKVAKVRAINAGGAQNIADICKKLECKMTYISTDYVFDGQGTEPERKRPEVAGTKGYF